MLGAIRATSDPAMKENTESMDRRRALFAGAVVACGWAAVLLLRSSMAGLADLYPDALPPHPYFLPGQALRLWILTPVAVAASVLVMVAPGALLVMASGSARNVADVAIKGFGLSFLLRWLIHAAVILVGVPWSGGLFITVEIVLCAAIWSLLYVRAGRVPGLLQWFDTDGERRRAIMFLALPAVLAAVLTPLIFWQDITADGLEALTSGLSLNDSTLR